MGEHNGLKAVIAASGPNASCVDGKDGALHRQGRRLQR